MKIMYDSKKLCYTSIILNIVFDVILTVNTFFGYYIQENIFQYGRVFIQLKYEASWLTFVYIFKYLFQVITGPGIETFSFISFFICTLYFLIFIINIYIAKRSRKENIKKVARKLVIIDVTCMILTILIYCFMWIVVSNL